VLSARRHVRAAPYLLLFADVSKRSEVRGCPCPGAGVGGQAQRWMARRRPASSERRAGCRSERPATGRCGSPEPAAMRVKPPPGAIRACLHQQRCPGPRTPSFEERYLAPARQILPGRRCPTPGMKISCSRRRAGGHREHASDVDIGIAGPEPLSGRPAADEPVGRGANGASRGARWSRFRAGDRRSIASSCRWRARTMATG